MPGHEGDLEHYPRKFGKYHLLAPLAQGGMGALYLAVTGDRGLERMMVIKTVLPHLADAEYVARFRDEAKVVIKLSHGNLIPVFDAGLVGGELFLAMDFVEGRDLRAVWNRCAKKQVAFPIDVAVFIVKELCRGLAYAHAFPELNLVHRDISPPNVLVSYSGEVKLTDFGLASSTLKLEKTAPGIIYGKVAYMSPEQARGEKLDGRSDMYATAIVLWELLTGRQLFPPGKDQPQDLVARAKNPEVMRPSKRAPRVPVELDEICLKALAPDKDDRYADCEEMRMALQNWLAQNAPTTDGSRMAAFLQELFSDDIVRERAEREEMISRVRTRALTLPPTDELRQLVEKSERVDLSDLGGAEPPVRKPGSVGRRASDRGDEGIDRRRDSDRRLGAPRPPAPSARHASADERGGGAATAATALKQDEGAELGIGSTVDGRYKVTELIGEGGMGKVYLAEHIEIGKRVALKVLHPSYSRMPDLVERFRREARAASKIGHPNIVDVTDSGATEDGSVYFVMEYLDGVELGSVIEREGALNVARALRITTQICRALSAAHREGIIHRDLKPENIYLISRGGEADVVKVLDFGIAKTTEAEAARERRLTSPGMAMGTPEYMAPEQAAGRPADARTDIYSLGAIMYEMITGVPPYRGDNFMEILTKKATTDPLPPTEIRPDLPALVNDLVLSAMARSPELRPQSMDALEYELNKCLSGRGMAVASILGMTADSGVVGALNPGITPRNLDVGIVQGASRLQSHVSEWDVRSGVSRVSEWDVRSGVSRASAFNTGPVLASAPAALEPARAASDPAIAIPPAPNPSREMMRPSTPLPVAATSTRMPTFAPPPALPLQTVEVQLKSSGMAVFGWLMLVLMLLGGAGAVAYVMFFNKKGPASLMAEQAEAGAGSAAPDDLGSAASQADGSGQPSARGDGKKLSARTDTAGSNDERSGTEKASGSASGASKPVVDAPGGDKAGGDKAGGDKAGGDKSSSDGDKGRSTTRKSSGTKVATADTGTSWRSIAESAKKAESRKEWGTARLMYAKLETAHGYPSQGYAVYKQAETALKARQTSDAVTLAQRSAGIAGPHQVDARILYAEAMCKDGNVSRAKEFFGNMLKQGLPASKNKLIQSKLKACAGR